MITDRELRFRAWNEEMKSMSPCNSLRGFVQVSYWFGKENDSGMVDSFRSWKIMQFTGLYDKNHVEIYEGDIVEIDGSPVAVEWHNGAWCVKYFVSPSISYLSHFDSSDVKVVGNIYQNKELLK